MQVTDPAECKVLLAGCGSIGRRHAQVLLDLGVKNMSACDPNPKQREAMREIAPHCRLFEDYADALSEKPDAVWILTPTSMHVPMAMQALREGCHVFIEKPLSNTSRGVEALKEFARQVHRKVMVGFCFRYHTALLEAKKLADKGAVGRLINIRALMGEHFPTVQPAYLSMYYAKYSGAFELVHDLDLAIWFADQPVKKVFGVHGAFSDIGIEAPDAVELLLEFEKRMMATVHLDFYQKPRRRQIELIGTEGVIVVEFASWDSATLSVYTEESKWRHQSFQTVRNDMFLAENKEFLDAICGNGEITCTIDEALKSLRVVEQVYRPAPLSENEAVIVTKPL